MTPQYALRDYRSLRERNGVRVGILGVAAAVVLMCALPAVAGAQVAQVNTTLDTPPDGCTQTPGGCTLREAIADPNVSEVQVPAETYALARGQIVISRNLVIRGTGASLATISAVGVDERVFEISDSEVQISHVRISNGRRLTDNGGGILVDSSGLLRLLDSEVSDNVAEAGGGIWADGELDVRNTLIVSNRSDATVSSGWGGGGVGLGAGLAGATFINTTLSDNEADGRGGGIFTRRSMSLTNVSLVENVAPPRLPEDFAKGAGLYQDFVNATTTAVTTATNTLLARNVNGGCGGTADDLIDSRQGLIDEPLPNTTCAVNDPTVNFIVADAGVGALADNGGLTRTHALLAGSPAIDRGQVCPQDDQRAVNRLPLAPCDIGAFEYVPPQPQPGGGGTQPPPDDELPAPEPGKTVNALPARGTVKIRLPGTNRFVELDEGRQIPVGTVVDTLKGRVTLVAAGGQQATFYEGIFKIGQGKGAKPLTTLTLVEKLSCPKAGKAVAAAKTKKKRRLWGDGSGKFRTKGKHSAATVVGTKWLVEDRCASTLTRVVRGRVSVRDFVKKKTVIVRAGKKYTARAKKK